MGIAVGLVLAASLLPAPAAFAKPHDTGDTLVQLIKRADKLSSQYHGELVELNDAKRAAKRAEWRARRARRAVAEARHDLGALAAARYESGGLSETESLFAAGKPETVLHDASLALHLSTTDAGKVRLLRRLQVKARRARTTARKKLNAGNRLLHRLEHNRGHVRRLIARYGSQRAGSAAHITPRMARVRALVIEKFGAPYPVGCYRPGGEGEHPEGRACDFMQSSGGVMPSSSMVEHGYMIANWAKANAGKLGVMYVIYRQRIWDARDPGSGWRQMEDRGSITANHYDHVHISVF